ncbi:MAG TPA: hypothetical protein VMU89_18775, partial [Thermomicrobiaceae bacterium]|nr:hypothetical protein [Thermomicrobiaceae bacterium]
TTAVSNVNLTFAGDPTASTLVPTPIVSGTYAPSDYGHAGGALTAPGMSTFVGQNVSGTWKLGVSRILANATSAGSIASWSLTITSAAPATVTLAPGDTSAAVGTSVTETATVTDAGGNLVADGTPVAWTITSTGTPNITTQDLTITNGQAVLTYSNTTAGADTVTVVAGTSPDTATASATVTWTPGAPASATLAPGNATAMVGTNVTETATVKDAFGNLVADGTPVAWTITSTGTPTITHQDNTTTSGLAVLTYTNTKTGTDTVTVAITGGTNPTASAAVTWTPGPPANLTLSPGNTTATVLGSVTETATVTDLYGNAVVDGTTVNFSVTGVTTTSGTATTLNGQASFTYSAVFPGVDTLTATAVGGSNPYATATITWILPASTHYAALGIANFTTPYIYGAVQTGGGGPAGFLTWQGFGASLQTLSFNTLVAVGPNATLFGTATVGGQPVMFRIDATAGIGGTVRLRLISGYDSGTLHVMSVRVFP